MSAHKKDDTSISMDTPNVNDLISYAFFLGEHHRPLMHRAAVEKVIEAFHAGKFRITVFGEVFDAFFDAAMSIDPVDFSFALLGDAFAAKKRKREIIPIFFDYDDRTWRASVEHTVTAYAHNLVYFINIKLPNDGYMFNGDYADNNDNFRTEKPDARAFVIGVLKKATDSAAKAGWVPDFTVSEFRYRNEAGRVEWYVWDAAKTHCISIKWEYGNHTSIVRKKGEDDEVQAKRAADLLELWQRHFSRPSDDDEAKK